MMAADPSTLGDARTRRSRPRDRKQRILDAAAARFWSLGYHQVGMADIAADVDIAPSALYRHFRGKQELLLATLNGYLELLEANLDGRHDLDGIVDGIAALAFDGREFGMLWEREAGHLPAEEQSAIRHRIRAVAHLLGTAIAAETGESGQVVDLRSWAVLSALVSTSHHRLDLDRTRFEPLLRRVARAVIGAPLPAAPAPVAPRGQGRLVPASRREALLAVAIRLFAERGYPSVGLADIGAAANIAGPSVYNHFDSKIDLLLAALNRGSGALWLNLHHVLADAATEAEALRGVVHGYTGFAVADRDIVSILVTETINLPADRREYTRRTQQEYVAEWVTLLRRTRPELDGTLARSLVHGALSVANSLPRTHHLRARPGLRAETEALAFAVLHTPVT